MSIVARDAETGELGVALLTAMFVAGAVVPWVRPGVGVVASQAIGESAYGPRWTGSRSTGSWRLTIRSERGPARHRVGPVPADATLLLVPGQRRRQLEFVARFGVTVQL